MIYKVDAQLGEAERLMYEQGDEGTRAFLRSTLLRALGRAMVDAVEFAYSDGRLAAAVDARKPDEAP